MKNRFEAFRIEKYQAMRKAAKEPELPPEPVAESKPEAVVKPRRKQASK